MVKNLPSKHVASEFQNACAPFPPSHMVPMDVFDAAKRAAGALGSALGATMLAQRWTGDHGKDTRLIVLAFCALAWPHLIIIRVRLKKIVKGTARLCLGTAGAGHSSVDPHFTKLPTTAPTAANSKQYVFSNLL